MGSNSMFTPPNLAFQPCFLQPAEYQQFGLPNAQCNSTVPFIVLLASSLIDQECGVQDNDGNGSLVYTTYQERVMVQTIGKSQIMLPMKPIVGLSQQQILELMAQDVTASGGFFTGVQASTTVACDGTLSGILYASGRYVPNRRDYGVSDFRADAMISPYDTMAFFGGPALWIPVCVQFIDYDAKTGEVWLPANIFQYRFSEVIITYTAGYDPNNLPRSLKMATAQLVKNLMASGGVTGISKFGGAGLNVSLQPNVIDASIKSLLKPFYRVRAY
jgi:hypothetical protein